VIEGIEGTQLRDARGGRDWAWGLDHENEPAQSVAKEIVNSGEIRGAIGASAEALPTQRLAEGALK